MTGPKKRRVAGQQRSSAACEAVEAVFKDQDLLDTIVDHLVPHGGYVFRLARVSKAFKACFDARDELDRLPSDGITQTALAELLALKPEDVQAYPFEVVSRRRRGVYHLFSRETVRAIVLDTGDWEGVQARRQVRAKRTEAGFKAAATRRGVSADTIKAQHAAKEAVRSKYAHMDDLRRAHEDERAKRAAEKVRLRKARADEKDKRAAEKAEERVGKVKAKVGEGTLSRALGAYEELYGGVGSRAIDFTARKLKLLERALDVLKPAREAVMARDASVPRDASRAAAARSMGVRGSLRAMMAILDEALIEQRSAPSANELGALYERALDEAVRTAEMSRAAHARYCEV